MNGLINVRVKGEILSTKLAGGLFLLVALAVIWKAARWEIMVLPFQALPPSLLQLRRWRNLYVSRQGFCLPSTASKELLRQRSFPFSKSALHTTTP